MIDVYRLLEGDTINFAGERWEAIAFEPLLGDVREVLARNQATNEVRLFAVQSAPRGLTVHGEVLLKGKYCYDISAIEASRRLV